MDRFWKYVDKKGPNSCWNWTAFRTEKGYGIFVINTKKIRAHRFSYELHFGKIPKGFYVCHKCDNPSCVNPKHLWVGTPQDNTNDMIKKGRNAKFGVGEKAPYHKLNNEEVRNMKRLYRKGMSYRELSEMFNITFQHTSRIIRGQVWSHIK